MKLAQALRLLPPPLLRDTSPQHPAPRFIDKLPFGHTSYGFGGGREGVAFVGAGGKTTAMFQLARELPPPVIVSATTHLGVWQIPLADRHIIAATPAPLEAIEHGLSGVILVTGEIKEDRTKPLDDKVISWLREFCGVHSLPLLVEADGSRKKPLKAPGRHEPPIPEFTRIVVVVAGLGALGKPLGEENVHRPEIFARLSGLEPGEMITSVALNRVLTHPEGGLKNIPGNARRVVLLNQADSPELQSQADALAKGLLPTYEAVVIASLKEEQIHAVHEPIAGIVLAAGGSIRYGQSKQLLEWRGEPFVRAVAKTALEAGLSPVIVVTGAHADKVEAAVKGLPVQTVHNQDWQSGQAASIKAGVQTLTPDPSPLKGEGNPGGAIFLLADQPQVTPTILHALVEEHASSLAPVIAPMVLDRRANPVLLDRATFPDLMALEGDVGGRGVFSKYRVTFLPWHDEALLLDVDTPEQYQRLKDLLE
jgi:molybdenum cofactor cytidylyltransferase